MRLTCLLRDQLLGHHLQLTPCDHPIATRRPGGLDPLDMNVRSECHELALASELLAKDLDEMGNIGDRREINQHHSGRLG